MKRRRQVVGLLLGLLPASLAAPPGPATPQPAAAPRVIGHVAASDRLIAFSYAGDLWIVGHDGGQARQITSGPAEDDYPAFSPDGTRLAFSRRTADDWDVYTVSPQGGQPRRLTYNPEMDIVRGWSPDGRSVLFMSHRDAAWVFRLYTIPVGGVLPTPLPLPRGFEGSFSADGTRLAYVPYALPFELLGFGFDGYRGGMASRIWIVTLHDGQIEELPREDWNDRSPMWAGSRIYFISDRAGADNLFVYEVEQRDVQQLTHYETYGIESAAFGGGHIVFVRDGRIHVFDPKTGSAAPIDVSLSADTSQMLPRVVSADSFLQSLAPTPHGRLVLGARGDVLLYDPASDTATNLTTTSGVAERGPALSPDGRSVAYFSDETGEYRLHIRSLQSGDVRKVPIELKPSFYQHIVWSPDSKRLAFSDRRLALWVVDGEIGGARRVTTSPYPLQGAYRPAWSADGRSMAYARYEANGLRRVYVYSAQTGDSRPITDERIDASSPVFDPTGRYLYFIGSADAGLAGATGEGRWTPLSAMLLRPAVTSRLYVAMLRPGSPAPVDPALGEPEPGAFAPVGPDSALPRAVPPGGPPTRRGERPRRPPPGTPGRPGARGPGFRSFEPPLPDVVALPLPADRYESLQAIGPGRLLVSLSEVAGSALEPGGDSGPPRRSFAIYDLSRPKELQTLLHGVGRSEVSADGANLLYRRDGAWHLHPIDSADTNADRLVDLSSIRMHVDPAAEWRQIYAEAWRLARDGFYDPDYHGQNLDSLRAHYAEFLPSITRRQDLNELLRRALAHLSVSHLSVRGGDVPPPGGVPGRIGMLGADYEIDHGRYRITRIYHSGHFSDASPLVRAPLDRPGVRVDSADYLLDVDGTPVDTSRNIYSYFAGKAMKRVAIRVGPNADGKDARTVTVVPLTGENTLRRIDWAESKRRELEARTGDKVGYIYVPNYRWGLDRFIRDLLAYRDRPAIIIDQRFAPGGITADFMADWLRRSPLYYYAFRYGQDIAAPLNAVPGVKALIVNEVNTSAAETFALMFKLSGVGTVVGQRTAGAGIGPSTFAPTFIDGGRVVIPERAAFDPAGARGIENHGVEPDTAVQYLPADWRAERDPQLDAALRAITIALQKHPPEPPKHPEPPKGP